MNAEKLINLHAEAWKKLREPREIPPVAQLVQRADPVDPQVLFWTRILKNLLKSGIR